MNTTEFADWYKHHTSRFTGVKSWHDNMPPKDRESNLAAWRMALGSVTLANAKWASDQIFARATKPKSFDDHPGAIVKETFRGAEQTGSRIDGDPRCMCSGTGMVDVMNDGRFCLLDGTPNPSRTVTVACSCAAGEKVNACRKKHPSPTWGEGLLPEFNPQTMKTRKQFEIEEFERNGSPQAAIWKQSSEKFRSALRELFRGFGEGGNDVRPDPQEEPQGAPLDDSFIVPF